MAGGFVCPHGQETKAWLTHRLPIIAQAVIADVCYHWDCDSQYPQAAHVMVSGSLDDTNFKLCQRPNRLMLRDKLMASLIATLVEFERNLREAGRSSRFIVGKLKISKNSIMAMHHDAASKFDTWLGECWGYPI